QADPPPAGAAPPAARRSAPARAPAPAPRAAAGKRHHEPAVRDHAGDDREHRRANPEGGSPDAMSAIRTALGAPPERSTREAAAVLRTGTVCPNCHRPAGANRSQSPLSGTGFGSGPGGPPPQHARRPP